MSALRQSPAPGPEVIGTDPEDKMSRIAGEVERFFQSVHADIEDWKFSMEDLGDGTRIFLRFQIHFNKPEKTSDPVAGRPRLSFPAEVAPRGEVPPGREGPSPTEAGMALAETETTEEEGDRRRADRDMDSFLDSWRHPPTGSLEGEFHKPGAPDLDARPPSHGARHLGGEPSPEGVGIPADRRAAPPRPPERSPRLARREGEARDRRAVRSAARATDPPEG